jgi:uncharacterized membrane protein YeaQ/YmgE (transglycosylase-associated protein family)
MLVELVLFVVFGIVVGAIGRFMVVVGSGEPRGSWIGPGVLGAVLSGVAAYAAGARAPDAETGAMLASFVGAIVFVTLHFARSWWRSSVSPMRRSRPSAGPALD